jgi:predicted ABC-type ATPase
MIYTFNTFLLEYSKNDPIPEINKNSKNAIFVFGVPGGGKSTFIKEFLLPKLKNKYKIIDPDQIIKKMLRIGSEKKILTDKERKNKFDKIKITIQELNYNYNSNIILSDEDIYNIVDNNIYTNNLDDVLWSMISTYYKNIKDDINIVYDTTGNDFERIRKYSKKAKEFGYNVIFFKIESTLKSAVQSNLSRDRIVQPDYQLDSFKKSIELGERYLTLNPDAYYIYNRTNNSLLKYEDNRLILKKQNIIKNGE